MDAQDVLKQMVRHYAALNSYADVGQVRLLNQNLDFVTRFSTYCKEPTLFRFEFARPHPYPPLNHVVTHHAVGFDGTRAYKIRKEYKGNLEIESIDRLDLAVDGAARDFERRCSVAEQAPIRA